MASAVSIPEGAGQLKNNVNVHSGDEDSADDAKRTGSSEDLSENEDGGKGSRKPVASSADEFEEKESETEYEKPVNTKESLKKESKPKKPKSNAPVKRNGTTKEAATVKSTIMMDTSAAETVKSEGGRRERKQVERFSIVVETPEEKAIVIPQGAGSKLIDISYVADQINKHVAADLALLHRLFFGRRGQTHEIKKNLRQFSGFGIEEVSPEYQKKKALISKWDSKLLKQCCDYLGLLKKGTKEQIVERVMQFCLQPADNGLKVKVKKSKSGSKKSSPKRKSSQPRDSSRAKPKSKSKAAAKSKGSDVSDDEQESDDEEKKRRRSASDEDEEDEPPKKKRGREGPTRQAATGKKYIEDYIDESEEEKVPKKKSSPKRPRKDDSSGDDNDSKSDSEKDEASSDEKHKKKSSSKSKGGSSSAKKSASKKTPLPSTKPKPTKKAKVEVSESESGGESENVKSEEKDDDSSADEKTIDEEIKTFLVNRIKDASPSTLKKITMKTLLQEVADKYPSVDLAEKKSYIKACVNEILEPST